MATRSITKSSRLILNTITIFKRSSCLKHSKHPWTNLCIKQFVSNRILPSLNPLLDIQTWTQVKLLPESDKIFTPTKEEVTEAEKLYIPRVGVGSKDKHEIKYLKGAYYPDQAPNYDFPEVTFIGRSNVGKSSLISTLFANVPNLEVRVSKNPGHTKLLLFYQCGKAFSLVDMPGYGFNQPENFVTSAEGFISTRNNLRLTIMLVDSHVGLQPMDYVAMEMLEEFAKPYAIVLTKVDRASRRDLVNSVVSVVSTIREKTQCCLPQPLLVSAHTGVGIPFLKCFIAYVTDCIDIKGDTNAS